eukprot:gnl/TRDRNA2_/TRDRNA2_29471_c0_seq1.p1 gnl/TRDRNA2_/TRDRNA2_29471_c0~~gnl/TRDRNA2_/TRDRNA2_29471_c0_seq1.p1  ORF type:complete len:559 (-),score=62.83 gnl/TRDRNA2_/TRDRNA2_29471_c0_seq1:132-1760(-)
MWGGAGDRGWHLTEPGVPDGMEMLGQQARVTDLADELLIELLLGLPGREAAKLASVARWLSTALQCEALWKFFLVQEFGDRKGSRGAGCFKRTEELSHRSAYRILLETERCRALRWHHMPCKHRLGAREGSPGVFHCRGFLFVFGGWGYGPQQDLHAGFLGYPFVLREISIAGGHAIPVSYEMKVTVLEEDDVDATATPGREHVLVAVTGGYLVGGYRSESCHFGILQIDFAGTNAANRDPANAPLPRARWLQVGRMTPRSNHSATFIPARASGGRHLRGSLLIFGGNVRGRVSNSIDVLDLETMTWEFDVETRGARPLPRNSHSALLVPILGGAARVLIAGGGTGDDTNGGPPRGGDDLADGYFLDPETRSWERVHASTFRGRGHLAFRLGSSVISISGGKVPKLKASVLVVRDSSTTLTDETKAAGLSLPKPRAFGGGCALPDGTLLLYGGWHPFMGTFSDVWVAHVDGCPTSFCAQLCAPPVISPPTAVAVYKQVTSRYSWARNKLKRLKDFLRSCSRCRATRRPTSDMLSTPEAAEGP